MSALCGARPTRGATRFRLLLDCSPPNSAKAVTLPIKGRARGGLVGIGILLLPVPRRARRDRARSRRKADRIPPQKAVAVPIGSR